MVSAATATAGQLCYVAGANHGGSTLLAILLDQHPRVLAMGEAGPIRKVRANEGYDCSCGDTLATCAFYTAVAARMRQRSFDFDPMDWQLRYEMSHPTLDRLAFGLPPQWGLGLSRLRHATLRRLPGMRKALARFDHRNVTFAQAAMAVADADVFVDATKDPERARLLADLPLPLTVVHLVRDPRAVAYSGSRRGRDPLVIADYWKRTHDVLDAMEPHLPCRNWVRLRYEDLCADPDAALGPLFQCLGLEPVRVSSTFDGSGHHVVGNKMRRGRIQTVTQDEEWKQSMAPEASDAVWRRTEATARRHGYER